MRRSVTLLCLLLIRQSMCNVTETAVVVNLTYTPTVIADDEHADIMNATLLKLVNPQDSMIDIKEGNTTGAEFYRSRTFSIDTKRGCFLLDGQPFAFVAGSMQYFRIPRPYWRDRIVMLKMAGLNTLHVSLDWSLHEPSPGVFRFDGELDFVQFIRIAQEEGLLVIVRPGPYIGNGRDFGGLPPWLLWEHPTLSVRRYDPEYVKRADIYLEQVLRLLHPLYVENGGPVFLLEIYSDGPKHSTWLQRTYRNHVGNHVGIVTTADHKPGTRAYGFGHYIRVLGFKIFDSYREFDSRVLYYSVHKIEPNGPLINTHFALGWPTLWSFPNNYLTRNKLSMLLEDSLQSKTSVSISSFHGGTDFGFKSGACIMPSSNRYTPQTTTYDVGSPLDEQGMPNSKYYVIRDVLNQFHTLPPGEIPLPRPTQGYGPIMLQPVGCLLDTSVIKALAGPTYNYKIPYTFEDLRQGSGFVLYSTTIASTYSKPVLATPQLRDRAQVYVNKRLVGVLERSRGVLRLYLGHVNQGDRLQLLVENQGRVYAGADDSAIHYKGLALNGEVYLQGDHLYNWTMNGYPFDDVEQLENYVGVEPACTPTIYSAQFQLRDNVKVPRDTFLDVSNWMKGVAFINGHNLGRYWPSVGPQESLYVPGCYLLPHPLVNHVTMLELERPVQKTATVTLSRVRTRNSMARTTNYTSVAMMVLMVSMLAMLTCYRKTLYWIYSIRGHVQH